MGTPEEATAMERAPRVSGCHSCHGTQVELDENNKPKHQTWPGGVGTVYPDGSIGTCTVCHERHTFLFLRTVLKLSQGWNIHYK